MSSDSPIPFATIGTSWITASFIASAHSTNLWSLKAIYSRSETSAQTFLSSNSIPASNLSILTDLDDLAHSQDVSVIYIASPNSLHYEHAKLMLEAGKHVVLEKPATLRSKELDVLFAIAKEKKVFLIEAFRHLHETNWNLVRDIVGKGTLGKLLGARFTYAQYSSKVGALKAYEDGKEGASLPNIFSLEFGGGALVDLGVYCISAAVALFGEPDVKASTYFPKRLSTGVDGAGEAVLKYTTKGGEDFVVSVQCSKTYNSAAPSEIYGENGTLVLKSITDVDNVVLWDAKSKKKTEVGRGLGDEEKGKLNMSGEAREFARCILDGDREKVEVWEGWSKGVVKVTEGLRGGAGIVFKGEN